MTAPPAAAAVPLAPGPVPPPVAGAPAGRVEFPVVKGLAVPLPNPVGKLVCVPLTVGEAEHEGDAVAVPVDDAVVVAVAVLVAVVVAVAVWVGVQLVVGVEVQEGVAVADAVAVPVAVAVWVWAQLDMAATAAPADGPVNAIKGIETSKVAVPAARPTSPTRCSFSQLLCRERRTIVTIPWRVKQGHPGSQVPSPITSMPSIPSDRLARQSE